MSIFFGRFIFNLSAIIMILDDITPNNDHLEIVFIWNCLGRGLGYLYLTYLPNKEEMRCSSSSFCCLLIKINPSSTTNDIDLVSIETSNVSCFQNVTDTRVFFISWIHGELSNVQWSKIRFLFFFSRESNFLGNI